MKRIIIVISALLIYSCSIINVNNIAPGYTEAFVALKNATLGYEEKSLDPNVIYNIPYASSYIKIGKGPKALMILESKNVSDFTWVTADGVYLVTRFGRIIQTKGLYNNLSSSVHQTNSFDYKNSEKRTIYYSYDNPPLANLKLESIYSIRGKQIIELFDRDKELTLVEEVITNNYLGWKAINKYWIDENNFVWKSEQYISPKLPKIVIEVTKKPS
tara:strand:+ start:2247 stop:2894 length:648 start_codon:yes stop_codon:yes gene_type:complete